nr:hypothetical protein [Tanacetum cinerariifolium]
MSKRARNTRGQSSSSREVSLEERIRGFKIFDDGIHQMHNDTLATRPIHSEYDPEHKGVKFRLGGEERKISLLELGWRVGLYSENQSREDSTLSAREAKEDDEAEEAAEEEGGGSVDMYQYMSRGD